MKNTRWMDNDKIYSLLEKQMNMADVHANYGKGTFCDFACNTQSL